MPKSPSAQDIAAVRRFNRFYTKHVGALREGLVGSPYLLPEARVIYEIAHAGQISAAEIAAELNLDAGYLSRLLRGLAKQRLIDTKKSDTDGRRTIINLNAKGKAAFRDLDKRTRQDIARLLKSMKAGDRKRLLSAMATVEGLLTDDGSAPVSYML